MWVLLLHQFHTHTHTNSHSHWMVTFSSGRRGCESSATFPRLACRCPPCSPLRCCPQPSVTCSASTAWRRLALWTLPLLSKNFIYFCKEGGVQKEGRNFIFFRFLHSKPQLLSAFFSFQWHSKFHLVLLKLCQLLIARDDDKAPPMAAYYIVISRQRLMKPVRPLCHIPPFMSDPDCRVPSLCFQSVHENIGKTRFHVGTWTWSVFFLTSWVNERPKRREKSLASHSGATSGLPLISVAFLHFFVTYS